MQLFSPNVVATADKTAIIILMTCPRISLFVVCDMVRVFELLNFDANINKKYPPHNNLRK